MELVPFHGSLETIILIKLTTDPPHGYKGILRNDLPRSVLCPLKQVDLSKRISSER